METVIIVIHLMVVIALAGVVLIQRSEGGGLGIGGGGGFMSTRGTANVLTRTTAILAAVFFATSLILGIMSGTSRTGRSVIDQTAPAAGTTAPASPVPGGGSLLDQLQQMQRGASGEPAPAPAPVAPQPAAPQAPSGQAPAPSTTP